MQRISTIVIVDEDTDRARAWSELLFAAMSELQVSLSFGAAAGNARDMRTGWPCEHLLNPDVSFIHYRNASGGRKPLVKGSFRPAVTVGYGGMGKESKYGMTYDVDRKLVTRGDVERWVSSEALSELLKAISNTQSLGVTPSLLLPLAQYDVLASLAHQCQGYLMVASAAFRQLGVSRSDVVRTALRIMEAEQVPSGLEQHLAEQWSRVRARAWWREPFDTKCFMNKLTTELSGQCDSGAVSWLANVIFHGDAAMSSLSEPDQLSDDAESVRLSREVDVVAEAFCEIHDILERKESAEAAGRLNGLASEGV